MDDGLLLVVPARVNRHQVRALIDSGATRCFVTPAYVAYNGSDGQTSGHVSGIRKRLKIFVKRFCTRSSYSYSRFDSES